MSSVSQESTNNSKMKRIIQGERHQIICFDDVDETPMVWLWYPYLPLSKLSILRGDPGGGKTYFALQIAAIISNGGKFPGQDRYPENTAKDIYLGYGKVLYISAEDDIQDTILPRLKEAGADLRNVHTVMEGTKSNPISFTDDNFEEIIKMTKPRLVIVDPIQAYMGAGVDAHRANEVRPIYNRLRMLAEKYGCAILMIEHLNKNIGGKPLYRGLGSIDTTAAVRSVMMLGGDENNPSSKGVVHIKSSGRPAGDIIGFTIDNNGFKWDAHSTITKEAVFGFSQSRDSGDSLSAIDRACEFLKETLAMGPRSSQDMMIMAPQCGVAEATLRRARERMGIVIEYAWEKGKRISYWSLPDNDSQQTIS